MGNNEPVEKIPVDMPLPEDEQLVSCEICLKTVPASEAEVSEAQDYVAYFCGLDCYEAWRKQQPPSDK